jgi:hypothetical protein
VKHSSSVIRQAVRAAWLIPVLLALAGCATMPRSGANLLSRDDMAFLEHLAADVVAESRVPQGAKVGAIGPNVTGYTVIRPGGRNAYPAFWIRDYAMSLGAGLITADEQRHALLLTARHQQDVDWPLPSGSFVPAGAIPDHISFGDKPIFYPGTLEDYEGQGGPRWGKLPSLDDHYFFIHMAYVYVRQTGDTRILHEQIRGRTLLDRLRWAYGVPPYRADNGLVYVDEDNRGVSFGFVDTIVHTGDLLFCSVLKYQAAQELAVLYRIAGDRTQARVLREDARAIQRALVPTFQESDGMLRASTGLSSQPDVWGTAYAVYVGAVRGAAFEQACRALARSYRENTLSWRGNVRHVRTADDFSATTAWEATDVAKNRYQNGAYWGTPVGWVAYAIAQVDPQAARALAQNYVMELRGGDYRQGPDFGSPWECMHPEGNHRQNPVYMTSVTCPLAAFRRLESEWLERGLASRYGTIGVNLDFTF